MEGMLKKWNIQENIIKVSRLSFSGRWVHYLFFYSQTFCEWEKTVSVSDDFFIWAHFIRALTRYVDIEINSEFNFRYETIWHIWTSGVIVTNNLSHLKGKFKASFIRSFNSTLPKIKN